jgi:hypothetical protein
LVEDSWAFDNGKLIPRFFNVDALENGDLTAGNFQGDGNGFKLGQDGGPHVLNGVVVWENRVRGIDVNGNGFGSLSRSDFLRLAPGSDLIDTGTDVGLLFAGNAPDLGAFERFASADFDEDGDVDTDDFAIWQSRFATTDAAHLQGDANRDGSIDGGYAAP